MGITKQALFKAYTNPGSPIAFGSPGRIFQHYNGKLSLKQIEKWLQELDVYSLHKIPKAPKPRNPIFTYKAHDRWEIDLMDVASLAQSNDNTKFLLSCVDSFSRFGFLRPLLNKSSKAVLAQLKSIVQEAQAAPRYLVADQGLEINNKLMRQYLSQIGTTLQNNLNLSHSPICERFNRTIKRILYQYLTHHRTDRYLDVLPQIQATYNSRVHRIIGMTPMEATKEANQYTLRNRQEQRFMKFFPKQSPKFKPGMLVRVSKTKGLFSRGFTPRFQQEIFRIKDISNMPIPTYTLETYDRDETLRGNFYGSEITQVKDPETFAIESILKERQPRKKGEEKQYLVKWEGYSKPTWIKASDLVDDGRP